MRQTKLMFDLVQIYSIPYVCLFSNNYYYFNSNLYVCLLGDNVDCWMEIQHGKGPWAPPVNGIVPLGSTLTLVVAINDYRGT